MAAYENNAYFWQKVDTLYLSSKLNIIHRKGDTHPRFKNLIYPVSYGKLEDTAETGGSGISVYVGTGSHGVVTALVIAADILEKSLDVKILAGCTDEETEDVLRFLNQTDYQKTVLIHRGSEIPSWGVSDN
jgi:inorganic pyrophosphatase